MGEARVLGYTQLIEDIDRVPPWAKPDLFHWTRGNLKSRGIRP